MMQHGAARRHPLGRAQAGGVELALRLDGRQAGAHRFKPLALERRDVDGAAHRHAHAGVHRLVE